MPRLLQRSRPGGTTAASSAPPHAELPPYEEPAFPMNDAGKRALAEISCNRETRKYEQHLAKSASYLRDNVGAINDVLFLRQHELASLVEKRATQGVTEKSEAEAMLEKRVSELEAQVSALTDSSEAALRELIDYRAELEDEKAVLEQVQQQVHRQKPRPELRKRAPKRRGEHDSDDDENGEDEDEGHDVDMEDAEDAVQIAGVCEILKAARGVKVDEYNGMSAYQRYAQNNDYISFKKTWHDAQHPEDQVPLPDASTWFDELGRPTKGVATTADDDDLVVEREIRDLKCPLSLQLMKNPYSNHKCSHTFEKSAIMDFLKQNGGVAKCPVCEQELRVVDLYADDVMLRRIKRAEREARRDMGSEDDEEDVGSSPQVERTRSIKKEKNRPRPEPEDVED